MKTPADAAAPATRTVRARVKKAAGGPYHHGALREGLLQAARAILEDEGYEALTLRGTARRAGVSQAAPYHHFRDKAALLVAVAAQGFRDFGAVMAKRMAEQTTTNPQGRLNAAGVAYVEFAVANPAVFKLMFSGVRPQVDAQSELAQASAAAYQILIDAVGALGPPAGSGTAGALAPWALVHGLATLLIEGVVDPKKFGFADALQLTKSIIDREPAVAAPGRLAADPGV